MAKDMQKIRMWDADFKGCRWPIGEDEAGFYFCCAERVVGRPYCSAHCRAAFGNAEPVPHRTASPSVPDPFAEYEECLAGVDQEIAA